MNRQNRQIGLIILGICSIVVLFLFVNPRDVLISPKEPVELDSGHRITMGTFARAVVIAPDAAARQCVEGAFAEIDKVDSLMSDYKSDSELSKVNRTAFEHVVKVSQPTFEVLQKAIEFSELSAGAFDITVGPLVDLWRAAGEANSPPTEDELQQAQSRVGYEKLILDANEMTVRFAVDGMRLDLGGIAKGYAIDKAIEAMQHHGAFGAMVDIGGDIRCFGVPPKERDTWRIGVQDPNHTEEFLASSAPLLVLNLTDAAIATSGGYRRFALIDGNKYSHIIDRKTAVGAQSLSSVTIIANDAITADALATAVSVLGEEKGLALIEKIPQTDAILISPPPDYRLLKTAGAKKYFK